MKTSLSLLGTLFTAQFAHAQTVPDQHQVVAGERLGRVFLGDSRAAVVRRLGKPTKTLKLNNGLISELWRGSKRSDTGRPNTLEVLFRRGVVTQIETTNEVFRTKSGLSVISAGESWHTSIGGPTITRFRFPRRANRTYQYHDWKSVGIAVELIETEFEPSPETLIVHPKGVAVIPDVGGIRARGLR